MLNTFQKKHPETMNAKISVSRIYISLDKTPETYQKAIVSDIHQANTICI